MVSADARLPVTELLASLSLATDLGTGQPLGHGLSTSLLAMSLAEEMGCGRDQLREVQQLTLIRFLGCTSDAAETARMAGGDEISFMYQFAPSHMGSRLDAIRGVIGAVGAGQPILRRARLVAGALGQDPSEGLAAHCEVAAMLAARLGLSRRVIDGLENAYERWDGGGPHRAAGEEVPLEVRIAMVARDVDMLGRRGEDVPEILRARRGGAYDPAVVDALLGIEYSHREVEWEEVMAAEPEPIAFIEDVDVALTAMADFVDIKSPWTRGHSRRVAELAGAAAGVAGLGPDESMLLARAGLVHDVGRVGVENGVWDRPGQLATAEWEKVRLHPYLTERVLSRCRTLGQLADLASSHHERMDGSGYHRQTMGDRLSMTSRILAASDVMAALTSERPQRPAHTIEEASVLMTEESRQGKLDPMAVTAVVSVAGGVVPSLSAPNPGGLSDREVEVLRLLARGRTNRQMAEELFISPKTVGRHVENIYAKIGVSTRAGAAVYAMEQRLLG